VVTAQLEDEEYARPLPVLQQTTLGKHMRHIIEFFEILHHAPERGWLCYENRKHDDTMEVSRSLCLEKLKDLQFQFSQIHIDMPLQLRTSYPTCGTNSIRVPTTLARELINNLEHAVHHMAIIKIGVLQAYPRISLPDQFGIAYSTLQYQRRNTITQSPHS
jgi:hypothetical protein